MAIIIAIDGKRKKRQKYYGYETGWNVYTSPTKLELELL